jgi:hypothetical protein
MPAFAGMTNEDANDEVLSAEELAAGVKNVT